MKDYYICIDIGGTDIKFAVINKDYKILYKSQTPTSISAETKSLTPVFEKIINILNSDTDYHVEHAKGMGVGFPGLVNCHKNQVKFMSNINIQDYSHIISDLQSLTKIPVKIANDAELALLAEHKLGAGKNLSNFVLLTLGTGLGCGIILGGKSVRTFSPYSCECGHLLSVDDGKEYGSLVSTRALVNQTKKAMQDNPNSKMWTKYNLSTVSGKTVFEFKDIDKTAKEVFDNYIKNLGTITTNLFTLLSPEVIAIGGGISKQGKDLTKPLEEFTNNHIFSRVIGVKTKIVPAKLTNDAGILGARCLFD